MSNLNNSLPSTSCVRPWHRKNLVWVQHQRKWWSGIIVERHNDRYREEIVTIVLYNIGVSRKLKINMVRNFVDCFTDVVNKQMDSMKLEWTLGVVEALRELYKNRPCTISYDLRTLARTGLIGFKRNRTEAEQENYTQLKRRFSTSSVIYQNSFETGSLVWAKYSDQWWAGITVEKFPEDESSADKKYVVFWLSDNTISELSIKKIIDFEENFATVIFTMSKKSKLWNKGVVKALHELYEYRINYENQDLKVLATDGLPDLAKREIGVPIWIQNILKNTEDKDQMDSVEKKNTCSAQIKELIGNALKKKEPLGMVCLGCYTTNFVDYEHPLFEGNLCLKCLDRVRRTMIIKGDDGLHYFCAVCGISGLIVLCDEDFCGRAYCFQCISDLTAKNTWSILLSTEKWVCFLCENSSISRVIYGRADFAARITKLYAPDKEQLVDAPTIPLGIDMRLNVFSVFDGIGTGIFALRRLKIPVGKYYASEIDPASIDIGKLNFGDAITYVGDITTITEEDIKEMSPIHLVIGGSPCNDLSLANPTRKGLQDHTGTGVLFFEFFRILMLVKKYNPNFYWMFENVASMPLACKQTISTHLQCEPVLKDSVSLSPQHRPRLFWGNLPSLHSHMPFHKTHLQDKLMPGRTALVPKLRTVTTKCNSLRQGKNAICPVLNCNNTPDSIWITELEQVFGLPAHYTDAGNMSSTQRQQVLGKAWSVPVITHLFEFLRSFCNCPDNREEASTSARSASGSSISEVSISTACIAEASTSAAIISEASTSATSTSGASNSEASTSKASSSGDSTSKSSTSEASSSRSSTSKD